MSASLLHVAAATFEAAAHIPVLAAGHPARRLHGHSYLARVRASGERDAGALAQRLAQVVAPLDHALLNDTLATPTDENLARWIRAALGEEGLETVGVQSTRHTGVDLDCTGHAHLWRRFRFEAAHCLPNVPAGHPCGRLHGHGFEVVLHAGVALGTRDLGIDYERLGALWQPLHAQLHQGCLNEIRGLENPTSELLARWIWERLGEVLPELSWVSVHETATAGCHYDGRVFRIWKETRFESALALPHVAGGRVHGHSYVARLHLAAPLDALLGWTIDYGDVRAAFTPVFRQLDHQRLDLTTVAEPDLAAMLHWLRAACAPHLPALERIDLYDTPDTGAMLWWGERGPALPGLLP